MKEKIKSKEEEEFLEKDPELSLEKRKYALCVDNLGKDEELNCDDINLIEGLVKHFKESWEKKEC